MNKKQSVSSNTSSGAKVLFLYPNERGMSTVPPSIALLSQVLKDNNHSTFLFDTTFYEWDDDISVGDADEKKTKNLNYRPVDNREEMQELILKKNIQAASDDFRKMIKEVQPDLIAVSCTETTFLRGLKLIRAIIEHSIPNLFGGVFPTFAPDLVMQNEEVDMLCVGEGENAIVDLANCLVNNQTHANITNLWVRLENGSIKKNPVIKPVDINEIPNITDIGLFGEERFYRPMGGKIRRLLPVETHRGCPYTCAFCNSPSQNVLYGGGISFFRKKKMKLVKEEIQNHIKKWDVEYIYFWADTFLAWNDTEFEEFCEMYSDIKLPFWCQTRIETITEDKFIKLMDVGLNRLTIGMEHGNEEFRRRVVKREYSNKDAIRQVGILNDLNIAFSVNNIIGFPDETRELAFDTIELNRLFGSDSVSCSVLVPFHGTDLRRLAEEKGYIAPNIICTTTNSNESMLDMPQWSKEDITQLQRVFAMYVKFPKERWPEIEEAETNPELHKQLSKEFVEMCWRNPSARIEEDLAEAAKGIM